MSHRYPLGPLLALTGWTFADVNKVAPCNGSEYRLRAAEGVTERIADRLATAVGLHPHLVWPAMAEHAAEEAARADAEALERKRASSRRTAAKRRRRADVRAAEAAYMREYQASERAKAAARAYRRRYYEANRERELARQREYDRTVRAARRAERRQEAA